MASTRLPKLPGTSFGYMEQLKRQNHHKPQGLTFSNSVPAVDLEKPAIGTCGPKAGATGVLAETGSASAATSASKPDPAWIAFERMVLRFKAYFQQPSDQEGFRVRVVNVLCYLEDDTIQVNEKRQTNAGLPQGTLIRRHRIPKPPPRDHEFYSAKDFNVGKEITLYGRTFKLADCDEFTRTFLTKLGVRVGQPCEIPTDPYTRRRDAEKESMQPLRPYDKKDTLMQFLKHDGEVLRFYCIWDDSESECGDRRKMVLHYFLADSTVELREVLPPNSGRDQPAIFLRRQKLPKDVRSFVTQPGGESPRTVLNVFGSSIADSRHILDNLKTGSVSKEFYTEDDFQIGAEVFAFGRKLFLYDCDEFTKRFYREHFGMEDFQPIHIDEPTFKLPEMEMPPPTGFGNDDDSLASCRRIVPMPSLKKMSKLELENPELANRLCLRFVARMPDKLDYHWLAGPADERTFVITVFLTDNTIQIFERTSKDSGLPRGKFLERKAYKLPDGSRAYQPEDFFIGASVTINSHKLDIFDADEQAIKYMEDNNFPHSIPHAAIDQLAAAEGLDVAGLEKAFQGKDPENTGCVDAEAFITLLSDNVGEAISKHQILTLARTFANADGNVEYSSLISAIKRD